MNDGSKIAAALFAVKSVSLIPTGNPEMVQKRLLDEYRRSLLRIMQFENEIDRPNRLEWVTKTGDEIVAAILGAEASREALALQMVAGEPRSAAYDPIKAVNDNYGTFRKWIETDSAIPGYFASLARAMTTGGP
jgi:hypothetical protein